MHPNANSVLYRDSEEKRQEPTDLENQLKSVAFPIGPILSVCTLVSPSTPDGSVDTDDRVYERLHVVECTGRQTTSRFH